MKKISMMFLLMAFLILGCQNNDTKDDNWGSNHLIRSGDIIDIIIKDKDEANRTLSPTELQDFMNIIHGGVYEIGQLDIGPADNVVEMAMKSGETKKLSLWLNQGEDLFVDHDDNGHYKLLLDEDERNKLIDILH
ncbi:hypothetical protein M4D52_25915 [Paenibacillus lactis]|uniref:hypothetical protein n=1 Tax=Paenibacillus lactis TaxID=228574 RepID=UPI00203D6CEE|nr:hypothetical protein [Paenibacillus lactis]MCM3496889.1 hypothetical protein [Paenibacillus lactis]